jgi:hypothetical protein
MSLFIIIILALISIILALWSIYRQTKIDEIARISKELKKKRVVYQHADDVTRDNIR